MTEAEWLRFTQPKRMLNHLERSASVRKLKLFGCASCRRAWDRITDSRSRHAVAVVERHADGLASDDALNRAGVEARAACVVGESPVARGLRAAYALTGPNPFAVNHLLLGSATEFARRAQAKLIADIFGNPFRPVTVDPAWRTSTAVALAEAIYADRAFDRLPILADALQDAGCEDADILDHCRSEGPHVRGCWVVDGVLGKQ